MEEINRRAFLQRGGALAGAAALASLPFAGTSLAATGAPGFTAARRTTYVALVEAVERFDSIVDASKAAEAADTFAGWYGDQPTATQRTFDALLDTLEAAPRHGGFSEQSRAGREQLLLDWAHAAGTPGKGEPDKSAAKLRRAEVAAMGANAAAIPFDKPYITDTDGLAKPPVVQL